MRCDIYWIERCGAIRVGVMPRPRGGDWLEEEIESVREQGVDVLVSLLTVDEIDELALTQESRICEAAGVEYLSFPIPDRNVPPDKQAASAFIGKLHQSSITGKSIVFHCRAGIGRSALMAACLLATEGMAVDDAFQCIADARGCGVPDTTEQRSWVSDLFPRVNPRPFVEE
jgi:protein-tyrosine phosphatase